MVLKGTNIPLERSSLFTNVYIIITYMSFVEPHSSTTNTSYNTLYIDTNITPPSR